MTRTLARQKFRLDQVGDGPAVACGTRTGPTGRFDAADEQALHARFAELGRDRFWDL